MTKGLDNNNHSVFSLHYHLILVVKYRRKVITAEISDFLKELFLKLAPPYQIHLSEWGFEEDHVHIVFRAEPKSELSKFINAYKSAASRLVKKKFPEICRELWKGAFWSKSFCLLTTGGAPLEIVKQYVQEQGTKAPEGLLP